MTGHGVMWSDNFSRNIFDSNFQSSLTKNYCKNLAAGVTFFPVIKENKYSKIPWQQVSSDSNKKKNDA